MTTFDEAVEAVLKELEVPRVGPGKTDLEVVRYRARLARDIVTRIERDVGTIAKCTCPTGFGSVKDLNCERCGRRDPEHTITGAQDVQA